MARHLQEDTRAVDLRDSPIWDPAFDDEPSRVGSNIASILEAIEALPEEEREAFNLVRVQGLTQLEAA